MTVLDTIVGGTASDLIVTLARSESLRSVTLLKYKPTPGLEDRLAESGDSTLGAIFELAERLRALVGRSLPYWESVLVAARSRAPNRQLIAEALRHAANESASRFSVSADKLASDVFSHSSALQTGEVLGVCSACVTHDGSLAHIPMLDFRCDATSTSLDDVMFLLRKLGQSRGAVLTSGRSFHYYGFDLISPEDWIRFMGRALLASPLIDTRYVGHRLVEGMATLRLTSTANKPALPTVVGIL